MIAGSSFFLAIQIDEKRSTERIETRIGKADTLLDSALIALIRNSIRNVTQSRGSIMKISLKVLATLLSGATICTLTTVAYAAADCTPAHKFPTITPGVLTVATYSLPPFSIPVNDTDAKGVDAQILKLIAAKECLKLSFAEGDASAVIQSIVSGKTDLGMGNWYRTAARAKVVGLSSPMYLDQMAIISKDGYDSIAALQGKRVGTVQGYLWTPDLQKVFGSSLTIYPTTVAMAQDLQAGRIDVGTESYAVTMDGQKKGGWQGLKIAVAKPDPRVAASEQPGQSTLPYTKSNQGLGDAIDADIEALHKSGEIGQILKQNGLDPQAAKVGAPRLIQ
jgi:polar amino acid transport system substrate-binding protein